jgi:hypothetical protein
MNPDDTAMSWDEWKEAGFHVIKGQKSHLRDALGVPQFTEQQVEPDRGNYRGMWEDEGGNYHYVMPGQTVAGQVYYRPEEAPPLAFDPRGFPTKERMDYHMSMLNPTHQAFRALESHLDSVFEKHHGGMEFDEDYGDW